jgi:hypothetical protein
MNALITQHRLKEKGLNYLINWIRTDVAAKEAPRVITFNHANN